MAVRLFVYAPGNRSVKKGDLEAKVIDDVKIMHSFEADLNGELKRCKANLGRIQSDAGRLKLQETQHSYETAAANQARLCREITQDRDAVTVALGKAKAVLKISQKRKHPGGKAPQRGFQPAPGPRPPMSPAPQTRIGKLGKTIKDLFPLGPLGRGPGSKLSG
jgi:hypothetical protein